MKLRDILAPECVKLPLAFTEKSDVIRELIDLLADNGKISDRNTVVQVVLAREATASTGIGHGLAVPHGKTAATKNLVMAIGKAAPPIDFKSKDGQPVQIVVLLVSPIDQTGPHIQALAKVSRLMLTDSFRAALDAAQTAQEMYEIIACYENGQK
jgi:fructose-specific phosphotransferase system IIA component